MTAQPTTAPEKTPWAQLVKGERVRGRGGLVWTIAGRHADPDTGRLSITLERDGERKHLEVAATATVEVVPLVDDVESAKNLMVVHTAADGQWATFKGAHAYSTGTMLAHLKIVHGIDVTTVGEKAFTRHIEAHAAGDAARPHEHKG